LGISHHKNKFNSESYDVMLRQLKHQRVKLSTLSSKIQSKEEMLKIKCDLYNKQSQNKFVSLYMNEIKHLQDLKNVLNIIDLGLMAVYERLDTLKIVFKAFVGFKPTAKFLNDVLKKTRYIPADMENMLRNFTDSYIELTSVIHPPDSNISFNLESPEASGIIKSIENNIESEIIDQFPNIPLSSTTGDLAEKMEEVTDILAADGGYPMLIQNISKKPDVKLSDQILNYIHLKNGNFDVYNCASKLRVPPNKIINTLYELANDGKLRFRT